VRPIVSTPFASNSELLVYLTGRIAFANTHLCDLVGIDHDKISGKCCFDFVFPEDIREAKKLLNKNPNTEAFRFRLRRIDGEPIWVDIQGLGWQLHGRAYAISAAVTIVAVSPTPA
jgi:PAS domain S-box-containing protein